MSSLVSGFTQTPQCSLGTEPYELPRGTSEAAANLRLPDGTVVCSLSPDRGCILALGDSEPDKRRGNYAGPITSVQARILDAATGTTVSALRERDGTKPETFGLGLQMHWSLDGEFVIATQMRIFRGPILRAWRASTGREIELGEELSKSTVIGFVADSPRWRPYRRTVLSCQRLTASTSGASRR